MTTSFSTFSDAPTTRAMPIGGAWLGTALGLGLLLSGCLAPIQAYPLEEYRSPRTGQTTSASETVAAPASKPAAPSDNAPATQPAPAPAAATPAPAAAKSQGKPSAPAPITKPGQDEPAENQPDKVGPDKDGKVQPSKEAAPSLSYREPLPAFRANAPASRYAGLSSSQCRRLVKKRKLPVKAVKGKHRGVGASFRVTGPFHGVTFVTGRAPSPYGILDCRMALVLDDFAKVLAPYNVVRVRVGSIYRKGAVIAGRKTRSQHSRGLALDIISMRLKDKTLLRVDRDYHAAIGKESCGPSATMTDPNKASLALRNVVCAAARAQLFHHMLTPCANRAHRDHLHFDIKRGAKYQSMR